MEYNVDREKDAVLDAIMRQDPGNRGLLGASPENPVGALRESLRRAKRAVLLTGFPVRLPEGAVGETDGPPGTADMAWALEQFGTEVRALTDRFSYDQLSAAMKARGCRNVPEMLPENEEARRGFLEELFRTFRPTHCITLERPGKGEDGHFHNMRGIVIDDMVTDSQEILPMAKRYGAEIISVGDGGNDPGAVPGSPCRVFPFRTWPAPVLYCAGRIYLRCGGLLHQLREIWRRNLSARRNKALLDRDG